MPVVKDKLQKALTFNILAEMLSAPVDFEDSTFASISAFVSTK